MNPTKIISFFLFILLLGLTSCEDDSKSVYETGQKVVSIITENDPVKEIVVDPAQKAQVSLQARIDQLSAFGIVVEVESNPDLIAEYNEKNGTDYQELSPSSYAFETSRFIFPRYSDISSHVNINLFTTGMQEDVKYLLPVQMIQIKGDENAFIDDQASIMYFVVSKLPPPKLLLLEDVELTTEIGPDKKNWFAAYATNAEGGHTFTVEEAAEQSHMMDFALVKHGNNIRLHPSIVGWQHGGDYHKFTSMYINGFKYLTLIINMNKLYSSDLFYSINTTEELVAKIDELKVTDNYNFYSADRMTSHNLQNQITGNNRVLIQGYGPRIGKNVQFSLLHIKEVTALSGGDYKVKFDIKYVDHDVRTESNESDGQNVLIDNPAYSPSNVMKEYKGIELTTEIGPDKKNWFSAYADATVKAFTQEEARSKSSMMDLTPVIHAADEVRFYSACIGINDASYKERIAPYINGFSRLTYLMLSGWRAGSVDATKPEHYDNVTDVKSMTQLIDFYRAGYAYPVANRVTSEKLAKDAVGVIAWGHKVGVNNQYGIYIVRDFQPTANGHYKVVLDIKVPESNARTPNSASTVTNPQ